MTDDLRETQLYIERLKQIKNMERIRATSDKLSPDKRRSRGHLIGFELSPAAMCAGELRCSPFLSGIAGNPEGGYFEMTRGATM